MILSATKKIEHLQNFCCRNYKETNEFKMVVNLNLYIFFLPITHSYSHFLFQTSQCQVRALKVDDQNV